MHRVIGICGHKHHGKDTAARIITEIAEERGMSPASFTFAKPVKDALIAMGVPEENLYDKDAKYQPLERFGGKSGRELMESLGTQWGRGMISRRLWTDIALDRAEGHLFEDEFAVAIFTDVCFMEEAVAVNDLGGILVLINRPTVEPNMELTSEQGLAQIKNSDIILRHIDNSGSLEDLKARLRKVVQQ